MKVNFRIEKNQALKISNFKIWLLINYSTHIAKHPI